MRSRRLRVTINVLARKRARHGWQLTYEYEAEATSVPGPQLRRAAGVLSALGYEARFVDDENIVQIRYAPAKDSGADWDAELTSGKYSTILEVFRGTKAQRTSLRNNLEDALARVGHAVSLGEI